jgi:hypothetical protein
LEFEQETFAAVAWTARTRMSFFNGGVPNFDGLPPSPILLLTAAIDTVCLPLRCSLWREVFDLPADSWFSFRVPKLRESFPSLLTYGEFLQQQQDMASAKPLSLDSLYQYLFETNSTQLSDLTTPTACFVLILLVLLIRSVKSVLLPIFRALGRKAGRHTHGEQWEKANEERIVKFGEYVYRLVYHFMISLYGLYYFRNKEWWAFEGMRHVGGIKLFQNFQKSPIEPGMSWYYLLQAAYNVDAMVSLLELSVVMKFRSPFVSSANDGKASRISSKIRSPIRLAWSETVRGDFAEMAVHHMATNLLIFGSSLCRMTRGGSMVFLVHDVSDIPVDLSKLANFLKWSVTTIVFFFTMMVSWFVTRLYILPFVIFRALLFKAIYMCEDPDFPFLLYICYRHVFWSLMGLLILLHLQWFLMFIRMFITLATKREIHDYSEHKAGEPNTFPIGKISSKKVN